MNIKKYLPIILILIIIASVVAGYFLVLPQFKELIIKKKELEIKDEQLKEREKYLSELDVISVQLNQYSEELVKIDSALPAEASIAALFYFIKNINLKNNLDFETIDISQFYGSSSGRSRSSSQSINNQSFIKMPFPIMVSGSYEHLKDFLVDLYLNSRIIGVKSLEFSFGESSLFDFNLDLETQKYNPAAVQNFEQSFINQEEI